MMLDLLLDVSACSGGARRAKAVEVGAVCVIVELLRDAVSRVTKRWLLLLKRRCKYPEG